MARNQKPSRVPSEFDDFLHNIKQNFQFKSKQEVMRYISYNPKALELFRDYNPRKRGSAIIDMMYFMILLLGMIFFALFMILIVDKYDAAWQEEDSLNNKSKEIVGNYNQSYAPVWDAIIVGWYFILLIALFISIVFLDNNPVFFIIFLILSFFFVFIALPVVNAVYSFSQESQIAQYSAQLPGTMFFVQNWLIVMIIFILVTIVGFVVNAKVKSGGNI